MRKPALLLLALATAAPAWSEDIVDVLRRSQNQRLEALPAAPVDSPAAQAVRASFERVMRELPPGTPAALHVIRGPVVAETLHGHVVAANESLAEMPERTRLFILAHELGHVMQHHWLQTGLLYQKWIPGEVVQAQTDAAAGPLGREASGLAHRHEFEADAYAARLLKAMGLCPLAEGEDASQTCREVALSVFQHPGALRDTPTHPGAGRRLAALRAQFGQSAADEEDRREMAARHAPAPLEPPLPGPARSALALQ
jgi:Zn-dependent protease with chaperone function